MNTVSQQKCTHEKVTQSVNKFTSIFASISTTNTHHIQECLLKGKWLRCIMDLSLGTPGHCPGFMPKMWQDRFPLPVTLSPCEPLCLSCYLFTATDQQYPLAPAQYIVSHTAVHCCDAPIQISFPINRPFWTSNLTGFLLGHHCRKRRLKSNKEILKIKIYSTIKSMEFQKRNKNPNKCDD